MTTLKTASHSSGCAVDGEGPGRQARVCLYRARADMLGEMCLPLFARGEGLLFGSGALPRTVACAVWQAYLRPTGRTPCHRRAE